MNEPIINDNFKRYADLQLQSHFYNNSNDSLLDEMEYIWDSLDTDQRQALKGMLADLRWVDRRGNPLDENSWRYVNLVPILSNCDNAVGDHKFFKALYYLRIAVGCLDKKLITVRRSNIYYDAGFPDYAKVFKDFLNHLE